MLKRLIIALLFVPNILLAQLTDNFEDVDISDWTQSTSGRWAASDINPLYGNYSLHHIFDNSSSDHDQVSFQLQTLDLDAGTTTWRFKIKYNYNPSSGNNWSAFLVANTGASEMFPGGSVSGYALGVNYSGSDDILRLYKITNGSNEVVVSTNLNWDADTNPSDTIALEVTRTAIGLWEVKYNSHGDFSSITSIGTGTDVSYTKVDYFGFYYKYTSSADRKLWIDDINIDGTIYVDNNLPEVDTLIVTSEKSLSLDYSEDVDSTIAVTKSNYFLNNNFGNPDSVAIDESKNSVELFFEDPFVNGTNYELSIENIEDLNNNVIKDTSINFLYYIPQKFDIVINEIFADPSPVIELPEYEYIEIYNTSNFDINLYGWTFSVGNNNEEFSDYILESGKYVVLCDNSAETGLGSLADVYVFNSFPSIPNSGQTIVLRNERKELIHSVSYSDDWYQDEYKSKGGWSLEQIDPLNPCSEENNWIASESPAGGTPGQVNSVNASNPDLDSPELLYATIIDTRNIRLIFNEKLDSLSAVDVMNYSIDNSIGNPVKASVEDITFRSVILELEEDLQNSTIYTLTITGDVFDCSGNTVGSENTARFAIPETIEENDVIVNEVLFNPFSDGSDFMEIYNRSEKTIDLKDLFVGTFDFDKGTYVSVEQVYAEGFLLFPNEYVVLSEDIESIKNQYYTSNSKVFIRASLPSLNDDEGRVILFDKIQTVIDDFEYNEDMHFDLLANVEGVSLERINFDRPTNDKSNWHSASEMVGFATPGYENSQFMENSELTKIVSIEPEVFSPDNDGFEDVANINFNVDEPGYVANIKIYDSKGRLVRYLVNNQLLGINGVISWDGLDENKQKAKVGVYVVYIELFDLNGNVTQYKETVVVAAKW